MKAFLMFRERDFDLQGKLPWNEAALTQDLELNILFNAMALEDKFLFEVGKKAILSGMKNDPDTILYRQKILQDCLKNPSVVRELYGIAVEAIEGQRKNHWGFYSRYPSAILSGSIDVLQMFVGVLKKMRKIAEEQSSHFSSEGFATFFAMLKRELGDEYFARVAEHLGELEFRKGVLVSAELGRSNRGINYVLRKANGGRESWMAWIFAKRPPAYTLTIAERDESGARALSELRDRGIHLAANTLGQSADHILSFFKMLRTELAFYIGCLNLHGQLSQMGKPTTFPVPAGPAERRHAFRGLYDVCLALRLGQRVVGNDVDADGKDLAIITGANQGGKSTFLRSIGLSQLLMQCGMFAPAEEFSANVCNGLFTHYKREEDTAMESGKLDEELGRMSEIVDNLTPSSLLLLNESFAATNEREGSEIARQIICALLESRVKIFFVTHLYECAHGFVERRGVNPIFLRAERQADGGRTFKLVEGEPLKTSYGEDLYGTVFGASR